MKSIHLLLFSLLFASIISTTNYHGYLTGTDGQYNGDFLFDSAELPLDTKPYETDQLRNPQTLEPTLIKNININLQIEYEKYIHLKITNPNDPERWEVPSEVINPDYSYNLNKNIGPKSSLYDLVFSNTSDIFSFELRDKNSNTFYTFSNETFLYTEKYLHFESFLTSNDIFGFGERFHYLNLQNGIYTIWPNDTGGVKEDFGIGGKNGYSHQPVALHKTKIQDIWLGFVFVNTNNQDVVIKDHESLTSLTHKTIGGIIDYYIIVDNSPENVIKNIQYLLGYPALPPYWAIGSQQCRYGYNSSETFKEVYTNYSKYEIPVDTMWIDIDSLEDFEIFTVDEKFGDLPNIIDQIHKEKAHFVPIVDIGVAYRENGTYTKLGEKLDVFIKSNYTKETMIIKVWPGATIVPDFFNPNATIFWQYGLKQYWDLVHYDGIWLDMNEVANLNKSAKCIGEEGETCDPKDNYYYYKYLPYLPGYDGDERTNMAAGTINENGLLTGNNQRKYSVYNVKPLIAYYENKETYNFMKNGLKFRPFILSRSANIGSGKYNAHWLGDNLADFKSMKNSLSGIFQFDIYGIPMTGDDICGFFGNTYNDLCVRWYNLGAFYPFSRNHNFLEDIDQYPWSFDETTLKRIKNAVYMRYSLLRYIYSHIYATSLNEKVGFFNPVFFSFPNDEKSYEKIDEKAMIGDAFILFPVFTDSNNLTDFDVTFPEGKWNYYPSGKVLKNANDTREETLSGSLDVIHLYMRGGYIVPYQNVDSTVTNSYYLKLNKVTNLIINADENRKAKGLLFFDDDEVDAIAYKKYIRVDLNYDSFVLNVESFVGEVNYESYQDKKLGILELWGDKGSNNNDNDKLRATLPYCSVTFTNGTVLEDLDGDVDKDNDKFVFDLTENGINLYEISKIEFSYDLE